MNMNLSLDAKSKISLIAGVLILVNALLLGAAATWFPWLIPTIPGSSNDAVPFNLLTVIGTVCGVAIWLSSLFMRKGRLLGVTLIAFSIPSVVMGGGFIIGFILGIISGVSTLRKPSKIDN